MMTMRKARRMSPAEQRYLQAQLAFNKMSKGHSAAAGQLQQMQEKMAALGAAIKSALPEFQKIQSAKKEAERAAAEQIRKKKEAFEVIKRQEEKRKAKAAKEAWRIEVEREQRERLPTRKIDIGELQAVRIDAKTTVWVKQGMDPEVVKRKFRERNKLTR